jgi:hypothetical protein
MVQRLNLRKVLRIFATTLALVMGLAVFTACDGANSGTFTVSINRNERTFDGGFSASADRVSSGRRNRTFNLTANEITAIHVTGSVYEGSLILVISQDGNEDGTEVVVDLSNGFDGFVDTSSLEAGRIRFSLRYDDVRNSNVRVTWN